LIDTLKVAEKLVMNVEGLVVTTGGPASAQVIPVGDLPFFERTAESMTTRESCSQRGGRCESAEDHRSFFAAGG